MKFAFPVLCSFLAGLVPGLTSAQDDFGLDQLYRLDLLPVLKQTTKIGSISSYDRSGGNDDGFSGKYSFVRKDSEGLVIAELQGPGVIYRVWTPTPTDDVLEFLFDGETAPRIQVKYRDLFLGKDPDFPAPLVGFGAGGYYCYVPIPFANSCVVRMRASRVQFYQINYALYGPETPIATFSRSQSAARRDGIAKARELFLKTGADVSAFGAPPGAKVQVSASNATVAPNGGATLFETRDGGRILGLRLSPAQAMSGKSRDLLLRVTFDGESPAVECPVGDFFGYAWGRPAMQSLLIGTSGSTNYCYFPMPFSHSAKIEVRSQRSTPVQLQAEVVHCAIPRQSDEGSFYALWRRENPTQLGEPYTFLDVKGRGHLAGVVLQAQGMETGKTLFFEGDDQTTIDGRLVVHGTGSEDFFNGGWYDVPDRWEKRISFPLSGCLDYLKHLGRTGAYRLFLGDAYSYRQSLLQTIEHGGEKNSIPTDYCSVAFFYSAAHPAIELAPPPLSARSVHDPKEVVFAASWQTPIHAWSFDRATLSRKREKIDDEEIRYLSLSATGEDWFGPHFLCLTCDLPEAGLHTVYLETVKGPTQGKVQLFQNENPIDAPVDLYSAQPAKSGRVRLGRLALSEGRNNLMLKLVGKNESASGLGLDLINLICVRETP